jgi:hypothetical protein
MTTVKLKYLWKAKMDGKPQLMAYINAIFKTSALMNYK